MKMNYVTTTCPFCSTGCSMNLVVTENGVEGVAPYHRSTVNRGKLCMRGLATAKEIAQTPRVAKPMVNGKEVTLDEAIAEVKKLSGTEVIVSPRITTEAMYLVNRYAKEIQKTNGAVTLADTFNGNASIADIANADVILFIGDCMRSLPVTGGNALRAKDKGAKILYAGEAGTYTSVQADETAVLNDTFEIPAAFTDAVKGAKAAVVAVVAGTPFEAEAKKLAEANGAKLAVLYDTNNAKALIALGCKANRAEYEKSGMPKTLIAFLSGFVQDATLFSEETMKLAEQIENLILITSVYHPMAEKAKVVIPMAAFSEYDGSFVNWEGRVQIVRAAVPAQENYPTPYEIIAKLSDGKIAYDNAAAIFDDIKANVPAFKDTKLDANGSFIKEA